MESRTEMVGILLIVLLASGVIYISLDDKVRIRIDDDKSVFYVKEGRWLIFQRYSRQ